MGKNLHAEQCPHCEEILYYGAKCCEDLANHSVTIYRVVNVDGVTVTTIIPPTYEERVINQLTVSGDDIVQLTKELQDYLLHVEESE